MVEKYGVKYKSPVVQLRSTISSIRESIFDAELAARECYDSFDKSDNPDIREMKYGGQLEHSEVLDKLIHHYHHESVAEHVPIRYRITGFTRAVLQEVARHRIGVAMSVRSTRYTLKHLINMYKSGDFGSFKAYCVDNCAYVDEDLAEETAKSMWTKLRMQDIRYSLDAIPVGKLGDACKHILPEMWMTNMMYTWNMRSYKAFMDLRYSGTTGSAWFLMEDFAAKVVEQTPKEILDLVFKK